MSLRELIDQKRADILRLAEKHGAKNVRVFGSVARGQEKPSSDIDFLVEMEKGRSLLDRAALLVDLQQLLNCNVDVATERSLKQPILEAALRDSVPV